MSVKNTPTTLVRANFTESRQVERSAERIVAVPAEWDEDRIRKELEDWCLNNFEDWDDQDDFDSALDVSIVECDDPDTEIDFDLTDSDDRSQKSCMLPEQKRALQVFVRGFDSQEAGEKICKSLEALGFTVSERFDGSQDTLGGLIETTITCNDSLEADDPGIIQQMVEDAVGRSLKLQWRQYELTSEQL